MNLLVNKAKRHDKLAFQRLMEQVGPDLYRVARAILKNDEDAADAMQETALTCWEKIGMLEKSGYFKTWLTRILINHCNDIYKKRSTALSDELIVDAGAWDAGFGSVEWQDLLEGLDEKYRVIIILHYVQGFKTREIAEILQVNESTIRGRLVTAREKLERQYKKSNSRMELKSFNEKKKAHC